VPLDGLRRDDADVVLKFLASTVEYNHPVDDPWLSAHKKVNYYEASNGKNVTHYAADSPITSMGCSVQVRWQFSSTVNRWLTDYSTSFASEQALVSIVPSWIVCHGT
jgi:hypothetical protein